MAKSATAPSPEADMPESAPVPQCRQAEAPPGGLPRLEALPRTGDEPIHDNGAPLGPRLADFWRWSTSDLTSNVVRGVFAEFLVAHALGIDTGGVRDSWAPFDLLTPDGIRVEVKSAAYVQSWWQRRLSPICFSVRRTRAWSADMGFAPSDAVRQADVYVFALLAHRDKATIEPLNVEQWRFFVVPTAVLDARTRSQHSITLAGLRGLAPELRLAELSAAVAAVAKVCRGSEPRTPIS
jgi:hypothetical protein